MPNQITKKYSLNVDPRILELLGPNLYTNIYYVLAELIANAYDADAKNVYIFANKDDIRVEDDGHGMSYKDREIEKYLNVAGVSRSNSIDSKTKSGTRHKMGRKGVGKLAALSVAEDVDIMTVTASGERSGFILSRRPVDEKNLSEIEDANIKFDRITNHGTAIVMRNPQYRLHKTLDAISRNLLKIFPLVNQDFKIHIIRENETVVIQDFDQNMMTELATLTTFGSKFSTLAEKVENPFPDKRAELVVVRDEHSIPITMKANDGLEHEYHLKILGWIGTYKSTRGRKSDVTDFPDNFISLFANEKLGEFNILPSVGQNKLTEVYIVGQLHIDLFELTELPDMALSNRQGYKSDDPRYEAVRKYIRDELLGDVLRKRELYTDLKNKQKKQATEDDQKKNEEKLKKNVDTFRRSVSEKTVKALTARGVNIPQRELEAAVLQSISDSSPDLGLKAIVDSQKKKILISQTLKDKSFSDVIYQMLLFNNVPVDAILYTNCDDEICRVPEGRHVYEYLRDFFVESYSNQKIYVLFVTSENTKVSWGAITEVGAAWITQVDHKIFNIHPFQPGHPLDNSSQWQSTNREQSTQGDLWMSNLNADILCQKIEAVCDTLGFSKKSRIDNRSHLGTLIAFRNDT
ncbi:MAG TPA: ATP-binding protein [Bacteriovoracaceae bacterium]|nr:ATP-binding protein [Bacteriovoracaceae bacterium]